MASIVWVSVQYLGIALQQSTVGRGRPDDDRIDSRVTPIMIHIVNDRLEGGQGSIVAVQGGGEKPLASEDCLRRVRRHSVTWKDAQC